MRHKLLVALDGGKGSSRTVRYVARACAANSDQDPRVILFNVLPNLPPSIEGARPGAALDLRVQFETETMDDAQQMPRVRLIWICLQDLLIKLPGLLELVAFGALGQVAG